MNKKSVPLDEQKRLSQSVLWRLQQDFFDRHGIRAWSTGTVPHHITSSPFIADAYSRVVFGFLRDCLACDTEEGPSSIVVDRRHPIYLVELGSGSGRFAYLFLKKFLALQRDSALKDLSVKYVMTDFSEQTLTWAQANLWFKPFIKQGVLDFARFDVQGDETLQLFHSGETISATNSRNPLVIIANYLFDSIPQDAFAVSGGELFETLVGLSTAARGTEDKNSELLTDVKLSYDYVRVNENYYEDRNWNLILADYKRRLPESTFLFPTAALHCIGNLHRLAGGRMLLLSGDRGYCNDEALLEEREPLTMAVHGSISMMVDYQIIGEYCRQLGGQVLHPGRSVNSLNISAFMFGNSPSDFAATREAYVDAIEEFGPDDFFTLKEGIAQIYSALTINQIVAFLRLSCWDYKRFMECLPALKHQLVEASEVQKRELSAAIDRVWDAYLPIGEEDDLAFEMGTLLLEMDLPAEALEFFHRSVALYSQAPGTAYNMSICCYRLGQMDQALGFLNEALELDPEFAEAKTLRMELNSVRLQAQSKLAKAAQRTSRAEHV